MVWMLSGSQTLRLTHKFLGIVPLKDYLTMVDDSLVHALSAESESTEQIANDNDGDDYDGGNEELLKLSEFC